MRIDYNGYEPILFRFQRTPTSEPETDDMIRIRPTRDANLYMVEYYDANCKTKKWREFTLSKSDVFAYLSTVFRSLWSDAEPYSGIQALYPGAPSSLFHARMDSATRTLIYENIELTMRSWPKRV